MSKRIKNFLIDPPSIQLDDEPCSLIVDDRNGNKGMAVIRVPICAIHRRCHALRFRGTARSAA